MPTFTISNAQDWLAVLRANPGWRDEVLAELFSDEMPELMATAKTGANGPRSQSDAAEQEDPLTLD